MATEPRIRSPDHLLPASAESQGLMTLIREVATDAGDLVRQEVALAKLELKSALVGITLDGVKLIVALQLAAIGGLCLIVFMILGIGVLLDGAYWAGALITGVILLVAGGLLTLNALSDVKKRKPDQTVATLKESQQAAQEHAKDIKEHVSRGLAEGKRRTALER